MCTAPSIIGWHRLVWAPFEQRPPRVEIPSTATSMVVLFISCTKPIITEGGAQPVKFYAENCIAVLEMSTKAHVLNMQYAEMHRSAIVNTDQLWLMKSCRIEVDLGIAAWHTNNDNSNVAHDQVYTINVEWGSIESCMFVCLYIEDTRSKRMLKPDTCSGWYKKSASRQIFTQSDAYSHE